jgi:hypothetical protein
MRERFQKRGSAHRHVGLIDEGEKEKEKREVITPRRKCQQAQCADSTSTPANSNIDGDEGGTQNKRTSIIMCMQKEVKRIKIAEKKKIKKDRQKAKEERKLKGGELDKKKQLKRESMNYDGEYIKDYGTHFFCNRLPSHYYLQGPRYQRPDQKDPIEGSAMEDADMEGDSAEEEYTEEVRGKGMELEQAIDSRKRPQVRAAARAHRFVDMQPFQLSDSSPSTASFRSTSTTHTSSLHESKHHSSTTGRTHNLLYIQRSVVPKRTVLKQPTNPHIRLCPTDDANIRLLKPASTSSSSSYSSRLSSFPSSSSPSGFSSSVPASGLPVPIVGQGIVQSTNWIPHGCLYFYHYNFFLSFSCT